jgi:cytochrome c oxidase subunit 2
MNRRRWLAAAASIAAAGCAAIAAGQSAPRIVRVHTRKFEFVPSEISLTKDEPVILEFVADDIAMGFRAVALGLSIEFAPGKVASLPFTPRVAGKFDFYCDVFCGDGHEDMDGHITVT